MSGNMSRALAARARALHKRINANDVATRWWRGRLRSDNETKRASNDLICAPDLVSTIPINSLGP
jgi:hypothetical protein